MPKEPANDRGAAKMRQARASQMDFQAGQLYRIGHLDLAADLIGRCHELDPDRAGHWRTRAIAIQAKADEIGHARPERTKELLEATARPSAVADEQPSPTATVQQNPRPRRILVTGSRTWTDEAIIRKALATRYEPGTVLVSGACPTGADAIAENIWRQLGGTIERHPAQWDRYGRSAGHKRNAEMVASKPDECVAFILDDSPGALDTARLAGQYGITTERHEAKREPSVEAELDQPDLGL